MAEIALTVFWANVTPLGSGNGGWAAGLVHAVPSHCSTSPYAEPWLPIAYAFVELISATPTRAVPGLRGSGSGTFVQVEPSQWTVNGLE